MQLIAVEIGSPEWKAARKLRYALFFEEHSLPQSVLDDGKEENAQHVVAVLGGNVVGYGRLSLTAANVFQISQMVVTPEHQGHGIGSAVLRALIKLASEGGASLIELNARLPAVSFYAAEGFQTKGETYVSSTTKVKHIAMQTVVGNA